jgi:hypothetical protein
MNTEDSEFQRIEREAKIRSRVDDDTMCYQSELDLAVAQTRNATLDEIADKIGKMPFGDTAASFAVWIREQKT